MNKFTKKDYTGEFNLLNAEKELIIKALRRIKFKKDAAKELGISERNLQLKLDRHNLREKKNKITQADLDLFKWVGGNLNI